MQDFTIGEHQFVAGEEVWIRGIGLCEFVEQTELEIAGTRHATKLFRDAFAKTFRLPGESPLVATAIDTMRISRREAEIFVERIFCPVVRFDLPWTRRSAYYGELSKTDDVESLVQLIEDIGARENIVAGRPLTTALPRLVMILSLAFDEPIDELNDRIRNGISIGAPHLKKYLL